MPTARFKVVASTGLSKQAASTCASSTLMSLDATPKAESNGSSALVDAKLTSMSELADSEAGTRELAGSEAATPESEEARSVEEEEASLRGFEDAMSCSSADPHVDSEVDAASGDVEDLSAEDAL